MQQGSAFYGSSDPYRDLEELKVTSTEGGPSTR